MDEFDERCVSRPERNRIGFVDAIRLAGPDDIERCDIRLPAADLCNTLCRFQARALPLYLGSELPVLMPTRPQRFIDLLSLSSIDDHPRMADHRSICVTHRKAFDDYPPDLAVRPAYSVLDLH